MSKEPVTAAPAWARRLVAAFRRRHRAMPWRDDPRPYNVWISEIMLQQTRVETVIPYYRRFLDRFPDVRALAAADGQDVLRLWEGLGYYSRARNLHRAARELVAHHGGALPRTAAELQALPGIGTYTAAAIASIAFGEPAPVVDGNVLRVFARFWCLRRPVRQPAVARDIRARLEPVIRGLDPSAFNQGVMELGALVCTPSRPRCPVCPLRADCGALRRGLTARLPVTARPAPLPHQEIAVGVVRRRGRLLLARRRDDQMLGGLWEFPGGKREPGETLAQCAARELREETGLRVRAGQPYPAVEHAYSHFRITLTAFRCAAPAGRARPRSAAELKWIPPGDLPRYPMPKANRTIARAILDEERLCAATEHA
jgi:A/G-specific adenine glycosylase